MERESKTDEFLFGRHGNLQMEEYAAYLSLCGLKTIIRIGMGLMMSLYDKDLNRVCSIVNTPTHRSGTSSWDYCRSAKTDRSTTNSSTNW